MVISGMQSRGQASRTIQRLTCHCRRWAQRHDGKRRKNVRAGPRATSRAGPHQLALGVEESGAEFAVGNAFSQFNDEIDSDLAERRKYVLLATGPRDLHRRIVLGSRCEPCERSQKAWRIHRR